MEGMKDKKLTLGRYAYAKDVVFGSAAVQVVWETGQEAKTKEGKKGIGNEREREKVKQTEQQWEAHRYWLQTLYH